MNKLELENKLSAYVSDIRSLIEEYVREHAKYKIGDVIETAITPNSYFVITQIGYDYSVKSVVYYGNKIRKSDGEITYFDMDCSIGTNEKFISKTTLKLKDGREISHIDEHQYFNDKIRINFNV